MRVPMGSRRGNGACGGELAAGRVSVHADPAKAGRRLALWAWSLNPTELPAARVGAASVLQRQGRDVQVITAVSGARQGREAPPHAPGLVPSG